MVDSSVVFIPRHRFFVPQCSGVRLTFVLCLYASLQVLCTSVFRSMVDFCVVSVCLVTGSLYLSVQKYG